MQELHSKIILGLSQLKPRGNLQIYLHKETWRFFFHKTKDYEIMKFTVNCNLQINSLQ